MRFVPKKKPLPTSFAGIAKGLKAEIDVPVHRYGRLMAKVLIFKTPAALSRFWKTILGHDLGKDCKGAVNALGCQIENVRTGKVRMEGDPRYFCVIGLCVGWLGMEVVSHEAVHAGFCYEKRVRRNLFGQAADFDEERIAYPAGAIAAGIGRFLHDHGFYK